MIKYNYYCIVEVQYCLCIMIYYMQCGLLWRATLSGDLQLVKKILSIKNAKPNWKNPQMHVSKGMV